MYDGRGAALPLASWQLQRDSTVVRLRQQANTMLRRWWMAQQEPPRVVVGRCEASRLDDKGGRHGVWQLQDKLAKEDSEREAGSGREKSEGRPR